MVRTPILAAFLTVLAMSGCGSNAPRQNAAQEIIALERSALDEWSQGNTLGYIDISADDVTWFDIQGQQLRIEGIEAVTNFLAPLAEGVPPHTYELVDPEVQVYGDIAVLTFHWRGTTTDGEDLPRWKATSVYHWQDGDWRMVHANWSIVQDV